MPTRAFNQYGALLKSGISSAIVLCVVILPAMMEALSRMRDAYKNEELEDFEDFVWFNSVKERMKQLYPEARRDMCRFVLEKMEIASVAQSLIKSPVVDALDMLANSGSSAGGADEN